MHQINSSQRLRFYIFIAFLVMSGILFYAYRIMQGNIDRLVYTVRESAVPDNDLIRLKEIWSGVQGTESEVRSYTITGNQHYLENFISQKDSLRKSLDSLNATGFQKSTDTLAFIKLDSLVELKFVLYDSLLELSYSKILNSALSGLGNTEMVPDSFETETSEGNILQRMFSSRYSRKAVKAKTDSIINERNKLVRDYNKNIRKIKDEEAAQLSRIKTKELALLASNTRITTEIQDIIVHLEEQANGRIKAKALLSEAQADDAADGIRNMVAVGLLVVLLLFILVLFDIEASNKRKQQLVAARHRAENLARAKEEFMSTMSHEIRTPLTSILGFSEKLNNSDLNESQAKFANAISGSSEHLLAIVNDVLDFTRIDSGKLQFAAIDYKIKDVCNDVLEALSWKAAEKHIRLSLEFPVAEETVIRGDAVRMRQVLFNIVGNAVKFTDSGSVTVKVDIGDITGKTTLQIRVADTGIGIPNDKLNHIFGEFVQAESSTEQRYGGSGLGLAITKRIVEQQGGSISVTSTIGKGSEFYILIPVTVSKAEVSDADTPVSIAADPLSGYTILLAEDDEMIRSLQLQTLQRLGANVIAVTDGKSAIRALENNKVDLLLIDIRMPEMGGPETVRVLRTGFESPVSAIPVIAMTANNIGRKEQEELEQTGFNDFLVKPFREKALLDKIVKSLSRNKKQSAFLSTQNAVGTQVIPPEQISETVKLYNLTELIAASQGNKEFVKRMTGLFLTTAFASLNNLRFYHKQQNWEQLGITAHRMIGSYKQMGVVQAAAKLKLLEELASKGGDNKEAAELIADVERVSNSVFKSLDRELKSWS
ncbi:MAG TPA: ATP-binding protein [Bacteroidia bacterium]|nr:ATP-binding protein [Bacteroidia bacterium]